jgi:hypothetical protein
VGDAQCSKGAQTENPRPFARELGQVAMGAPSSCSDQNNTKTDQQKPSDDGACNI